MKLQNELVLYLDDIMNKIDLGELYHLVMNTDTIERWKLNTYCEALYYKQLIFDHPDKDELNVILSMLNDEEKTFTKVAYLYFISRLERLSKKSCVSLYI